MQDTKKKQPPFVGKHFLYPSSGRKRLAEGGRRTTKGAQRRASSRDTPLVSILTVCWNSAETIEQTIMSVQAQTYGNIEHIIVDGASKDATLDIIRKHEASLEYFLSEPDDGLYYAMNKALELASGDYILILNSDDWYVPDCVEALVRARMETKADFVSGMAEYVDADGKFLRLQPSFSFDGNMLFMMPLRHETMLLSRDIYNRVGLFNTEYRVIADREFTTRVYEQGHTHHEIKRPLMSFRDTGVSTVNLDAVFAERCRLVSQNFPFLSPEDAEKIGFLEKLTPEVLEALVKKYAHPRLSRAAADMVRDRQSRKAKLWMPLDHEKLRRVGAGSGKTYRARRKERMLRVATFVTSDHGGAGLGSQRRVEALRSIGVDARIYCMFKNSPYAHVTALTADIPNAETLPRPEIHKVWRERAVVTTDTEKGLVAREFFSKTGTIIDFKNHQEIFDEADIVHFHWPVGMVDFEKFGEILAKKPVVWTPADMNPFTGGCHYSEGCQKFTNDCKRCHLLSGSQTAHEIWKVKKAAYDALNRLVIVSPSNWLAERARKSSLWGKFPVHLVPNALPVHDFTPTNKMVARQALGLPMDKKLILFGADNVKNLRKGGDLMLESVRRLRRRNQAQNVEGVFFGSNTLDMDIPTHSMGHITDLRKLSLVYAASDVLASPSREDSGPMTVAEAMLSGTPVVAFNIGNAPEIIKHKETGFIARREDVEDFTNGLVWALHGRPARDVLIQNLQGCLDARAHNDPETAAYRHLALYQDMLDTPV